jgi:hypothetical protein
VSTMESKKIPTPFYNEVCSRTNPKDYQDFFIIIPRDYCYLKCFFYFTHKVTAQVLVRLYGVVAQRDWDHM